MAKSDFCFTFYDGDAARDVSHMNRIERGGYFDIIISQRKFGHLTKDQLKKILGKDFDEIFPAIELVLNVSEEGLFFVEWLEKSELKAKSHSRHQSVNGKKGGRPTKEAEENPTETQIKPITNPNENQKKPLEDGDGNEDEYVLGNVFEPGEFTILGILKNQWQKAYPVAFVDGTDIKPLREISEKIYAWDKLTGEITNSINVKIISTRWQEIISHCKDDPHLSKYSISQINKYFSSVTQSIQSKQNGKSINQTSSGNRKASGAEKFLQRTKEKFNSGGNESG